jgi:glycosyltransferase involved in cell wall biosynthesis
MRLSIVTDAWYPQVNGVVTTIAAVSDSLGEQGHAVDVIHPGDFRTLPCPFYPEIRLALGTARVAQRLQAFAPDRVHVVTEGPLGWAAIRFLRRQGWRHTTSFHTRFPEYVRARLPWIPLAWGYALLRAFHRNAAATLVPTAAMARELTAHGFEHLAVWERGVDTRTFSPEAAVEPDLARPIHLYVGRVAPEKNIEAFLDLDLVGTKVVVGDGPDRARLEREYPEALFPGYRHGAALAAWFASADVFVFPSRTDTFGLVMLEAMACGTPVAAYPVTGPIDVVRDGETGCLHEHLATAIQRCLTLDRSDCTAAARRRDWRTTVDLFLEQTVAVGSTAAPGVSQPAEPR